MKLEITSKLLPPSDKFSWVHIAKLGEKEAELKHLKPFPALAQKRDLGLPDPSCLEEYLREDAGSLIVHKDGTTEETPLHEWAKNPLPLDSIIEVHWPTPPMTKPPSGVWVSYEFFGEDGSLLAEVRVGADTPMHIKQPKGIHHLIVSWSPGRGESVVYHYFRKEASDVSE